MHHEIVEITPQMAKKWLENRAENRSISTGHVKALAYAMANGRWVLNGETFIFDDAGRLIDGQHRLSAIVMSGVTVPALVAYGVSDPRAFESIDLVARTRTVADVAQMEGVPNATKVAAVARRLLVWEQVPDKTRFTVTARSPNKLEVSDALRDNLDEIQNMYNEIANSPPHARCKAGSALITALILCNRIDDITTLLFIEPLKTGENLKADSPVYHLRERLIMPPERSQGKSWETEVMALTIKAWNKFRRGESTKTLRWRQEGDSPERFPIPGK